MALAYGDFHELNLQLRFLLFEIGIGLPQSQVDYFITLSHKESLKRLQEAALRERLIETLIPSHHVHDFIEQLKARLKKSYAASSFFQWNSFAHELDESIANEALNQAYRQRWNTQLKKEANPCDSLWSWLCKNHSATELLLFLEQWGSTGHPYHPAFRAKRGFTRREVLQYSPEFQAKLSLHWGAIRLTDPKDNAYKMIIAQEFPDECQRWGEKLKLNHLNPQEYIPIPIHPWHWRNQLQSTCASMVDNKSLFILPHHQTVSPLIKNEIMMPAAPANTYIQLAPLDDTAQYDGVNSILMHYQHYQHTLFLTRTISHFKYQTLAANIVQTPLSFISEEQQLVPLPALFALSPVTNTPLLIELINASGLPPTTYFTQYCHKVLYAQLHLMAQYDVALQLEQHHVFVIVADHQPQGLVIREGKPIKMGDRPLTAVFIESNLHNNIYYWINTLNHYYHIPMQQLWSLLHQVFKTLFIELSNDVEPHRVNHIAHQIFHSSWVYPCVLTQRLMGNAQNDIYVERMNSLRDTAQ